MGHIKIPKVNPPTGKKKKRKRKTYYSWDRRKPEIGGYDPELDEG